MRHVGIGFCDVFLFAYFRLLLEQRSETLEGKNAKTPHKINMFINDLDEGTSRNMLKT